MYIGSNLTAVARLAQESETAWIYTQVFSLDFYMKIEPFNFSAALEVQRLQAEPIWGHLYWCSNESEVQDDPALEACQLPLPTGHPGRPDPLLHGPHPLQEHLLPLHHWHRRRPSALRPPPHFPSSAQAQAISLFLGEFDLIGWRFKWV